MISPVVAMVGDCMCVVVNYVLVAGRVLCCLVVANSNV